MSDSIDFSSIAMDRGRWRSAPTRFAYFHFGYTDLCKLLDVACIEDVRVLASELPRSYEVMVRDRIKFRVGRIVYLAFSRDETVMGFAFPKDEREALVASEPGKFLMPCASDLRYNWVQVRLDAIDRRELHELVIDAWCMVVPKSVAAAYFASRSAG